MGFEPRATEGKNVLLLKSAFLSRTYFTDAASHKLYILLHEFIHEYLGLICCKAAV